MVFVILLVLALFFFTAENGKRITSENRKYLLDNAAQVAASLDSALTDGYSNIRMLSDLIGETLTSPDFDVANIQQHIQNSVFDFIEFADRDGMDHNITGGVSDARDRQYYLDAKNGNSGMELIYVSRATHETLLMFYSPLQYRDEFVGSLVGVYQASNRITKLLSSEYFGETAVAYLATDEGRIIASNQGFDPQQEMYVADLAEDDPVLEKQLQTGLEASDSILFSLPGNKTGGCMIRLPKNGGYLIQIFPPEASRRMIASANALGYGLVAFLLVLYLVILLILVRFYHSQQKQVEEARNQAEVANEAKTNFLFNMSHDIRTPMNAILGYTDIGLRHVSDIERSRSSFEKIKASGDHLLNLINDILEMSRIEAGRLEIAENPMDIRDAIEDVGQMGHSLAISKSIDFRTVVGDIQNPYILADELHVNEVLINLISNAVKYTKDGGKVEYRVDQISAEDSGSARFRFTVKDNGIGMSEEFQEHLFETFSRENTATVSRQEGAGLGLSIVKKIVDLAGGTIRVQSKKDEGSTFTVEFPFRVMDAETEAQFKETQKKHPVIKTEEAFDGKRVLLVEDNEMNREIAAELLKEIGMTVESAADGAVAVSLVSEKQSGYYDFILMDIQMPVMNGYEATAAIRKLPGWEEVPIIALSANAFKEDVDKSLAAGMNAHVAKPINIKVLMATMRTLA